MRLGPYEVTALIDEGGMGQVYRATDTNLARQVAIKILPGAFAADAERLACFEREARTLASLIAQIYGSDPFITLATQCTRQATGFLRPSWPRGPSQRAGQASRTL
jgi:hypothetical protein